MQLLVVARSASTSNSSAAIWKQSRSPNDFSRASEIATLRALPPSLRKYAFFLCWTRKEAYIKARGEGLSMPLDQFDVSLIPGEPAALLSTQPDSDEALRWSLRELTLASGYAAALAVEGRGWSLSCWQWPRHSGLSVNRVRLRVITQSVCSRPPS